MTDQEIINRLRSVCRLKYQMEQDRCTEISFHDCDVFGGTIRKHPLRYDIVVEAAKLPHLKKFDIRKCKVRYLPDMVSRCLEHVDLSCNDLAEVPKWIMEQKSLKHLNLGANKISEVPDLSDLPLETLKLHKNSISRMPKTGALKSLNLYLNKMDRIPTEVFGWASLEVFTFGVSGASELASLAGLPNLRWLTLSVTEISTLPEDICSLKRLEGLQLAKNRIVRLPENMGDMTSLKALTLYSNELSELPESFYALNLSKLNLARNPLLEKERVRSVFGRCDFLEV